MKKVFTLIVVLVLCMNYSKGQVRITEIKPIGSPSEPAFFELYCKGSASLSGYKFIMYVNTGSKKVVTVSTFASTDYFKASTDDLTSSTHTRGAVVFSLASMGSSTYSRLYSDLASVNRYTVTSNNIGTAQAITDKDPFNINQTGNDISASDKVACFLFNGNNIVDFVTNIDSADAGSEFAQVQGLGVSLNYPVTSEKRISVGMSGAKSYQLNTFAGSLCTYKWQDQNTEDPGTVNILANNVATWEQDYYFWKQSNTVGGTTSSSFTLFNEVGGSIQQNGSYLSNGKFEFFLYVINPTQFQTPSNPGTDLKLSILVDVDGSGNTKTSPDFYLNEYPEAGYNFTVSDKTTIYITQNGMPDVPVDAYKISFVRSQLKKPMADEYYSMYLGLSYAKGTNCFAPGIQLMQIPFALPVSLSSMKVSNLQNSNKISWSTSSEQNNKGFEIQRSIGNTNDFKTIGFVGTRAKDGNSQTEISYSFEDADVKAGQTHYYRLNQIDFDGKSAFSPVKSIKPGSIESNLNVYPNPSQGSFTVNTGSNSGKLNIFVMDNTGRVVNQFMNVSTSNTRISNLKKGFYTLKIVNTESGEQSAQRVVVQ